MSMVSQLCGPYKLYRGWSLNTQRFAHVGAMLAFEWQAHAHEAQEAHRGANEC